MKKNFGYFGSIIILMLVGGLPLSLLWLFLGLNWELFWIICIVGILYILLNTKKQ